MNRAKQGRETKREPVNKEPVTLESVLAKENLNAAWSQVKANDGAAGVDGLNIEASRAYVAEHWIQIETAILAGRYQPAAVRAVTIPKPDGGERTLGIPTVLDRLIQQAIHQQLSPVWEPDFSESSYGFRPGRSAHDAVRVAQKHIKRGKSWVIDIDLKAFFDRIDHDKLMHRVGQKVRDKRLLRLIGDYLRAPQQTADGRWQPRKQGTPQGGVMTPWTHLVILSRALLFGVRGRRGRCRRADGGYSWRARIITAVVGQRDAMAHGDRVLFHDDFFDQQPNDFLFLDRAEILGR